jgi:alanine racemase
VLRRDVGGLERRRAQAVRRGDVDDATPAPLVHARQHRADDSERRLEHHVDDRLEPLRRKLVKRGDVLEPRVVDDDVRLKLEAVDDRWVGEVGLHGSPADRARHHPGAFAVHVEDDDVRARCGEPLGARLSDSASGSRDEDHSPAQVGADGAVLHDWAEISAFAPTARSEVTIDLRALRANARRLRAAAGTAELWAVVKADGYGHGAEDAARVALAEGATAVCVATAREGAALREAFREPRILVMGPLAAGEDALARSARLEVAVSTPVVPEGLPVHLKVETGMGRWGMKLDEALALPREGVVGVMSHLATADEADEAFARTQIQRFTQVAAGFPGAVAHLANSAATLRFAEARFDAVRCGLALYGLSPFGDDPARHGLEPVLSWRSYVAQAKTLAPGESAGYGRRFVAERPTRVGIVPVGYADGFRRGLSGGEVVVAGTRRRVVGAISMDALAVELGDEEAGAPVTLLGDGVLAEELAARLDTINYEITCGIRTDPRRSDRRVVDG